MIRDVISSVLSALAPAADDSAPRYDFEYLADCNYKYIETSADRDGQDVIRCNICGRYFQPSDISDAFDHTEDEIDALAEAQQDAQFDYSDLLQEPAEEIDNVGPASN